MDIKAIFLDIDGVLNNAGHIDKLIKLIGREQYLILVRGLLGEMPFDYRSCTLLRKLIAETESKVILSSAWRLNQEHISNIEKYTGIHIDDRTPSLSSAKRGEEIKTYLDMHPEIKRYIILDDDSDMLEEQKENFIKIDSQVGFCGKYYIKAIQLLN